MKRSFLNSRRSSGTASAAVSGSFSTAAPRVRVRRTMAEREAFLQRLGKPKWVVVRRSAPDETFHSVDECIVLLHCIGILEYL
ncbi:unnamed protein product [Gongylonema pulchrum]|uniref:Kinesin motor domain-containing protein n=1 Tax=Gongylonema pulchrum TaxID=637853 RepID=A0A183E2N0_9BILA|nr:unnamed protein product [Gongylonema pulchrum]